MLKKIGVFCLIWAFSVSVLFACDVCGGGNTVQGLGLLTNYKNNTLRLGYFQSAFHTVNPAGIPINDRFGQLECNFRYAFNQRMRADVSLPFGIKTRQYPDETLLRQGLGDARLMLGHTLLNRTGTFDRNRWFVEVAGGLSLPTGDYDSDIHDENLPLSFNTGRGAVGYICQLTSVYSKGSRGFVGSIFHQSNGKSKNRYRYGSRPM